MQQYPGGLNFPAGKEEVASGVLSDGALQDFVDRIRNAATEQFHDFQEVLRAI